MAKRYAISPILPPSGPGPLAGYRIAISDLPNTATNADIPVDLNTGIPLWGFALCIFNSGNLPAVQAVPNVYVFPDYALDATMDGMEAAAASAMVQNVQAYDFDGNGLHVAVSYQPSDSYRQVLQSIGQQLNQAFNISTLDLIVEA